VGRELKAAVAQLAKIKKEQKIATAVVTAIETAKGYSLQMLGQGKKGGGTQQHQKARFEVLDRVLQVAQLSPEQTGLWTFFKSAWDDAMSELHQANWGQYFAEMVQQLLNDLLAGTSNALSVFMQNETKRVLSAVPALILPPASRL
jgi:hypothetical protein